MTLRISKVVLAVVVAAGFFRADIAQAQQLDTPLQLSSIEWLVADSNVVVRGVVVDVVTDKNWEIVTLKTLETLKGIEQKEFKFALQKFDKGDAALAQAKKSKREFVWLLKRQDPAVPGEAPEREQVLARNMTDLYAPFVAGRPGEPALPMIPLNVRQPDASQPSLAFLTTDLQALKTPDELVKAIRTTIAATKDTAPLRSYAVALPHEIAERTGFSRAQNLVTMPVDGRLEALARRLIQTPGVFLSDTAYRDQIQALRLEGVKALRLFQTEANLAIVRAWLDDPMSIEALPGDRKTLIPSAPKGQQPVAKVALPTQLDQVPEISFQQHLSKSMKSADAQLHTAITIQSVHLLNQKKTDAFVEALTSNRPDLRGLPFAMGETCRMKPEAGQQFVAALDVFHKLENTNFIISNGSTDSVKRQGFDKKLKLYMDQAAEKKIDPSASVAALMQVLAPEDEKTRLELAKYLEGVTNTDSTHALAKLAIFSAEADIRTAAIEALKTRDQKDYTPMLVAGLKYPWPTVAEHATEAIVKLGRKDLVANLIDVLDSDDPRAPQTQEVDGKSVPVVRELVRLNHHHNCLLCHTPGPTGDMPKEQSIDLVKLLAPIPMPSEPLSGGYNQPSSPDQLVRIDVTYLRQDFSMRLKVANAEPWPELQRFDFLVRTRELTNKEAAAYQELLQAGRTDNLSPYQRAALSSLRELTGMDAAPTATAWRKVAGL